ncbi:FMN-binding negative transcriptional regulator [Oceanibacterium hippocampi]|uniref:Protease synthase and sporulation protein PAI 2 n=1 Tax=Oceanibacterium hippocampi TaxID=745714 RepID=A0A1Y5RC22_9PROT|nr:FMN-binding negative transcriptional regulator [Oceanibacterium hippocampi]SLN13926.1 Protease synthase and sporulation protein PAI 2 [Oceanibacterium hippocampi]
MYIPPHFAADGRALLSRLLPAHGFGLLITTEADGTPLATHLPLLYDAAAGAEGTFYGHVARGNPHSTAIAAGARALVIISGPHAYVSPRWYAAKESVPTWNYLAVHAHGQLAPVADADTVHAQQDLLVATYEGEGSEAWSMARNSDRFNEGMMRGITAFALPVERLEGKAKLSQNKSAEDQARVAAALAESDIEAERDTAAWMRRDGA